jgi:glycosyltransferase involved in cell wall biosynthesis
MTTPTLSIIIPAFNRVAPLVQTLISASQALEQMSGEIILVDDGSDPPLSEQLLDVAVPYIYLRQTNQGSIVARMAGLKQATGTYILFLDSDDLLAANSLAMQLQAVAEADADISYSNFLAPKNQNPAETIEHILPQADSADTFFLQIQPPPHAVLYRRSYLLKYLVEPLIPMHRAYDPAGDIWLYYNLSIYPAFILKQAGAYAIIGAHTEKRYSHEWEVLGAAALGIAKKFIASCPKTPETLAARSTLAKVTFNTWRALPYDMHPEYDSLAYTVWQSLPAVPAKKLGGKYFQLLAKILGVRIAARCIRRIKRPAYKSVQSINEKRLQQVLHTISEL